jgi:amino acid permease
MTNHCFNLIKATVGVGVLSLPAGIAAFADAPSAVLPAAGLIATIGAIAAYNFSLLGRLCAITGATSYRDAWSKSVGESTAWIPGSSCVIKTCFAVLAYSMVLGDTFSALFETIGMSVSREKALVGLTLTVLLPLCLLKDLSSLAPFSLAGIAGMLYTAVAMAIRYFDGSYAKADGFAMDVAESLRPAIGTKGASAVFSPNAFILICTLSTAYMAHFNAAKFYLELKDNTIARWNTLVVTSFSISILFFIGIAAMGFATFGGSCNGFILNNYSTKDPLIGFGRVAVAFALVFTYPLAFVGCRDGFVEMLKIPKEERTDAKLNNLTYMILACVTAAALKITDLSFIMSFGGATLGNALIYVYPALMFRSAVKNMGDEATKAQKLEVYLALAFAAMGIGMGCVGTKMALASL